MSLLLDALKRAEQEKHGRPAARESASPATANRLELAPLQEPATAQAAARAAPATAVPPKPAMPRPRRTLWWIAGSVLALPVIAAIAYVWYSIAALTPPSASTARLPAVRPLALAPPALETPERPPPRIEPAASAAPKPAAKSPAASPPASAAEGAAPESPLLQMTRTAERPRIAPEIAAGYEALRKGNLDAARRSYAAAQSAEPANLDAVLGLATVEARHGERMAAAALYRHALEIDPRNATALAGLAALADRSRPEALEAQLLRDLAQHPESAALQFTLGNLYASHARWSQAQAAYFEAHRLDPSSPEILHNLAVSLDRLGQPRAAAGFYRKALAAARGQASAIDAAAIERRLAEIGPAD